RSDAGWTSVQFRDGRNRSRTSAGDLPRRRGRVPHEGRGDGGGAARRDACAQGDGGVGRREERATLRLREVLGCPWGHGERPEGKERSVYLYKSLLGEGRW